MPVNVADTSFLFALYGSDAHTAAAKAWSQRKGLPLWVTSLARYELGNALRFAAYRKVISRSDASSTFAAFEADLQAGYLHLSSCDYPALIGEADRLSGLYTFAGGHRSFDILHVAAARLFKARAFLSFDANQRKLAAAVGLTVGP